VKEIRCDNGDLSQGTPDTQNVIAEIFQGINGNNKISLHSNFQFDVLLMTIYGNPSFLEV